MLSLRSVNQFYGQNHILWDVDLDLAPGTCTGVLGRQGMGKTTLVNCIMGRLPINSGSISWKEDGSPPEDLLLQPAEQRAQMGIGYVPQGRHIFTQMSVEDNLLIALLAGASQRDRHRAIPEMVFDCFRRFIHCDSSAAAICRSINSNSWPWRAHWCCSPNC